ncbi:MAG: thiosulfate sulfurtransferase GlpE [Planctomycetota bacterium]|jgi:thiosulfate sulfurtransferase|nr:thiosulfate sulfurtransferase GlpE [Planctomycetota bacterium]
MNFEQIDVNQVRELIRNESAILVDIRDPHSYQAGHIEGAQNLNDDNIEEFLKNSDRNAPLVIYCYHGISSQNAAHYFSSEARFKRVFSMIGGYESWEQADSPPTSFPEL